MPSKFPMVATYHVTLWLNEDYQKMPCLKDNLVEIAEKYQCHGFGDPRLLFFERDDLITGDITFTFEGCTRTSRFLNDILPLEYLVEAKVGRLGD
ncbi:hypothetical protein GOV03_00460 [Candidatus Woesearchaeota archaeon]|nr:hypothetical protein [Candidatus Woesearchaeota archaeon]